jgi:hypothetical protein
MSRMAKGRGEHSRVQLSAEGRRKRAAASTVDSSGRSGRFVRAFADALRDILQHEQHERSRAA